MIDITVKTSEASIVNSTMHMILIPLQLDCRTITNGSFLNK